MLLLYPFFIFFNIVLFPIKTIGDLHLRVMENLVPNQEIHLISDKNMQETIFGASQFLKNYIASATDLKAADINDNQNLQEKIDRIFHLKRNVAIVVALSLEKDIYRILSHIGNSLGQLKTISRIWTVVIWPKSGNTEKEIESLRDSPDFIQTVNPFHLNSLLYFAFNLIGESSDQFVLYEGYRAGNHTILHSVSTGIILLNCNYCMGISLRRFNFHQRLLKVTAVNDTEVNDDIHVYLESDGTVTYSEDGLSGSMHEILQQLLNFTTQPMLSKIFGVFNNETKRWEGLIGDVAEGKADIGMSITIFQSDRAEVVSFLPPADEHLINAFFTPSDEQTIRDIFAQPFEPLLWAAVVTTWILLASCMVIFSLVRKRYGMDTYWENDSSNDDDRSEHDFTNDSFIWALGTACQQGWDEHPKANSLRAIFISGSFTGVVAYAGYSAAIVSTLSLRTDSIQNPQQLLRSNLHVGIRKGFISSLLEQKNAKDTMSHFYEKVGKSHPNEQYLNVSSGLDRLLHHPYAFITTRDTIYDLMKVTTDDKIICSIKDLPILKYGFPLGYSVPKYSPFREILRYAMTMIREPGILYRLRLRHSFQRRCLEASENVGQALGMLDVFTAFMILLSGCVLSIVIMIIERMHSVQQQFPYMQ